MGHRNRGGGMFVTRHDVEYPSLIRSVQRGTITIAGASTSNTATITAVNVNNAVINFLGATVAGTENADHAHARVTLTDSTTVTATKGAGSGGADDVVVSYEVIEYVSGVIRSIQRGTITTAAGTATATITAVNTAKSAVNYMGFTTTSTTNPDPHTYLPRLDLTNSTTVTATATATDAIVGYQVVEWW